MKLIAVLACYAVLTAARMPAWESNLTIWSAAAYSDADDPWALTNDGHYRKVAGGLADAIARWQAMTILEIPNWLPNADRYPYVVGHVNLASFYLSVGDRAMAERVSQHAHAIAPSIFVGIQ